MGRIRWRGYLALAVVVLAGCSTPESDPFDAPSSTTAGPQSLRSPSFLNPIGKVGCLFAYRILRCDIQTELQPEPIDPQCPPASKWAGFLLPVGAPGSPNCAGDTILDPTAPRMTPGGTWSRAGITCVAKEGGLTCDNRNGDAFALAPKTWKWIERGTASLATETFMTPSRNIICGAMEGGVRCDIASGLRPEPTEDCLLDWVGLWVEAGGSAGTNCAGDAVPSSGAPVLEYGEKWMSEGITCASDSSGLTCVNEQGRGFFLSRTRWIAAG
jgi:hypothetical protein